MLEEVFESGEYDINHKDGYVVPNDAARRTELDLFSSLGNTGE